MLRMRNQLLTQNASSAAGVVGWMAAIQAQDYYGALLSVGVRSGLDQSRVIAALESRKIIRTWPHRGTLHFVLAEDAAWMTALSAPRIIRNAARRREQLGLSDKDLVAAQDIIVRELQSGELTRPELLEKLELAGQATKAGRGYHILAHSAQRGLTYIGPMRGKQQTFGLLSNLPVKQRRLEDDEARAELLRRYMMSHGPATLKDFMWWSGMTNGEAKPALEEIKASLASFAYAGQEYWLSKDSFDRVSTLPPPPKIMLLAGFDEYILGYNVREPQLSQADFMKIVPGGNGVFHPTLLVDGRVAGIWRRTLKGGKRPVAHITFEYFAKLPASVEVEVRQAVATYGNFLGMPTVLQ